MVPGVPLRPAVSGAVAFGTRPTDHPADEPFHKGKEQLRHRPDEKNRRHRTNPEEAAEEKTGHREEQVAGDPDRSELKPLQFVRQDNRHQFHYTRPPVSSKE